jgi:hypothetical protein
MLKKEINSCEKINHTTKIHFSMGKISLIAVIDILAKYSHWARDAGSPSTHISAVTQI